MEKKKNESAKSEGAISSIFMTYKCQEVETGYWSMIHKNVCEGLDGWMFRSCQVHFKAAKAKINKYYVIINSFVHRSMLSLSVRKYYTLDYNIE